MYQWGSGPSRSAARSNNAVRTALLWCGLQGFRSGTLLKMAKAPGKPPFCFLMNDRPWEAYERGRRQLSKSP